MKDKEDISLARPTLTGKELVESLRIHYGSLNDASRETGIERTTLQKWRSGERNPSPKFRNMVMALLQSDIPKEREARILRYQKQISKSGRIKWIKRD